MISFSKLVKEELLVNSKDPTKEEADLHLVAAIQSLGTINYQADEVFIEIKSIHSAIIRNITQSLKQYYPNLELQVLVRETKNFHKSNRMYILKVKEGSIELLKELGLCTKDEISIFTPLDFPKFVTRDDNTIKEYLKFLFIVSGSINDPKVQRQYHLEIVNSNDDLLKKIEKLAKKYDINFKITYRKNTSALYLNKGEEISDFLKLIGAFQTLFMFEDQRLTRDIRAAENRLINAEIANDSKRERAANEHLLAIQKLKKGNHWKLLKDKTRYVGELREKYPEASLADLVELSDEKISKSNIRHHLKLIVAEAEKL